LFGFSQFSLFQSRKLLFSCKKGGPHHRGPPVDLILFAQSGQTLRRPLLQGELVGNHCDELAITSVGFALKYLVSQ